MKRIFATLVAFMMVLLPLLGVAETDQKASDMLYTAQKMVRESNNITVTGTHTFSLVYNGEPMTTTYTDVTVTFHDPLIIHNTVVLNASEAEKYDMQPELYHLYMVQMGNDIAVYSSQGTEEYLSYAEEIPQDKLVPETMGELDSLTTAIDNMVDAQIDGEETITVNDTDYNCIRIVMTANVLGFLEELIHNALLGNPAFDQAWSDEIEVSLAHLLMPVTYWIDKDTGMLVQYESDLTEIYDGIYAYIQDDFDGGLTYTSYMSQYQVTGVNDAEEINIPAKFIAFNEH